MKWLSKGQLVLISGVSMVAALVFYFFHFTIIADSLFGIVTILTGYPIAKKAFQALSLKIISI